MRCDHPEKATVEIGNIGNTSYDIVHASCEKGKGEMLCPSLPVIALLFRK
jgi:hypothetical protein